MLEKTLESSLDCKEIRPVNPKGNQSWISIGRTEAEAETPILWPSDAKSWLIEKDPDAGKDWRQQEKGTTEDKMVGWNHRLDGREFAQAPGVGDGLESLACYSPWSHKESDMTERLNWTELNLEKHWLNEYLQDICNAVRLCSLSSTEVWKPSEVLLLIFDVCLFAFSPKSIALLDSCSCLQIFTSHYSLSYLQMFPSGDV